MKLTAVTALALAAIGLVSTSASAQTTPNYTATDLILGFEVNDGAGQGATTDLEIDLGSSALFTPTYSQTFSQVLGSDLVSTYGANWASRTDLVWGVGGVLSDGSVANNFDLTSQVNPKQAAQSALAPGFGAVGGLAAGASGQPEGGNASTALTPTSQSNSFKGERTVTTDDFSAPGYNAGQSETTGPIGSINLYQFQPNSSRNEPLAPSEGVFALSGSGSSATFTFNATATPEPASYALGVCAMLLFWVLKRRNSIV